LSRPGGHGLDAFGGEFMQYHRMHDFLLDSSAGGEAADVRLCPPPRIGAGHAGIRRECLGPLSGEPELRAS
jgi:hypothetical protein